jgi:hypothetical protein
MLTVLRESHHGAAALNKAFTLNICVSLRIAGRIAQPPSLMRRPA